MKRIVINSDFGGFSLSDEAIRMYGELKNLNLIPQKGKYFEVCGLDWYVEEVNDDNFFWDQDIPRDDPDLARVVEQLGSEAASGRYAALKIIEIPDDVEWILQEYDGSEWIAEKHRTWS